MNKSPQNQSPKISWLWCILILLFIALLFVSSLLTKQRSQMGLEKSAYYDSPKKLFNYTFRETRVTIADMLWVRVDTYFHAALTPEEHEMIHPGHPEHEVGHQSNNSKQSGAEFLPLIRLVTDLDPNFIEAYRTGAWWLSNRMGEVEPAVDYLKEGIEKNPNRFELHYDLAWLYFKKFENYTLAKDELLKAAESMDIPEVKVDVRDHGMVMELLGFTYEKLDDPQSALTIWKKIVALNVIPYSEVAKREIKDLEKSSLQSNGKGLHVQQNI